MVYNGTMTKAHTEFKLLSAIAFQRATSDVVTPWNLALRMVDGIPAEKFNTEAAIPGSGFCTFALALIHRGWDPSKITCIELDPGYATLTQKRIGTRFGVNVVHADFLTWATHMEFDVILTNPPYQRPREVRNVGAPLWPDFLEMGIKLLKPNGYLSYVVPSTWMNKSSRSKAWKVIAANDLVSVIPDVKEYFPGVGGSLGFSVVSLKNQPYQGQTALPDGRTIDIRQPTPINNSAWDAESIELMQATTLALDVQTGPINPSINSSHWSPVKTASHQYEIFYSTAKNRRSIWCDQPIGDHGKLKLAIGTYGDIYGTAKITTAGCGRQVQYVLGTQEELEHIQRLFFSDKSQALNAITANGAYHDPMNSIVNEK